MLPCTSMAHRRSCLPAVCWGMNRLINKARSGGFDSVGNRRVKSAETLCFSSWTPKITNKRNYFVLLLSLSVRLSVCRFVSSFIFRFVCLSLLIQSLDYFLYQGVLPVYQEIPCLKVGGTCRSKWIIFQCGLFESIVDGKCPRQGPNVKCCLPCT